MEILDYSDSDPADEGDLSAIVRAVGEAGDSPFVVVVPALGRAEERLIEAGRRSAAQDLVLASTMAEGMRTRYMQVAHQLIRSPLRKEIETVLSHLFEELTGLLEGIYLIGELSPRGHRVLGSYGERATSLIVAQGLRQENLEAQAVCDRQVYLAVAPGPEDARERLLADFGRELSELATAGIIAVIPRSLRPAAGE